MRRGWNTFRSGLPPRTGRPTSKLLLGVAGLCLWASGCAHLTPGEVSGDVSLTTASLVASGPFTVRTLELELSRGDRQLPTTVWFPEEAPASAVGFPLVIYSHGFLSFRSEATDVAETLASHGYVVMAADFPHTHWNTPGGARIEDVVNQPGDVSFLIDTALQANGEVGHVLHGKVDSARIGVAGVSLGGLTATLTAFHPRLRDPRIRAAVSIAGVAALLTPTLFASAPVPYLGIYGDADGIIAYGQHGRALLWKAPGSQLLTIHGGSHTAFAHIAKHLFFWARNPDDFGCLALVSALPPKEALPYAALGGPAEGIEPPEHPAVQCVAKPFPRALRPWQQQELSRVGVLAFFESHFQPDAGRRAAYSEYLSSTMPRENAEVRVETASPGQDSARR